MSEVEERDLLIEEECFKPSSLMESEDEEEGEMDEVPIEMDYNNLSPTNMRRSSDCSLSLSGIESKDNLLHLPILTNNNTNNSNIPIVQVRNPEKHGEGFKDAFVSYEIFTQFDQQQQQQYQVRRRYQDFINLTSKLSAEFDKEGIIIMPSIPDKQRFEYMDRFSPEFIKKRQIGLERFLQRCFKHDKLSQSSELANFLQHQQWNSKVIGVGEVHSPQQQQQQASPVSTEHSSQSTVAAVVEKISDVVSNAFTSTRAIDEKFKNMKRATGLLEDHLEKICTLHGNISKSYLSLSESMFNSSRLLDNISSDFNLLETLISENDPATPSVTSCTLRSISGELGQVMEELGSAAMGFGSEVEQRIQNYYNELVIYCRNANKALKERDQRQFAWQDLEEQVKGLRVEHAALLGEPSTEASDTSTSHYRSAVMSFFSEKIDSIRGIDPIVSKSDRMRKIEGRVDELEKSLKTAKEVSTLTDSTLEVEYCYFLQMICHELRDQLFPDMASVIIANTQQQLQLWQTFNESLTC